MPRKKQWKDKHQKAHNGYGIEYALRAISIFVFMLFSVFDMYYFISKRES